MRNLGVVVAVLIVGSGVIGFAALWWWAGRAVDRNQGKASISWWGTRNGWRYTNGTDGLLDRFHGAPFDEGTSHDVQDLLSGSTIAGRPALLMQFSWYHAPDLPQGKETGASGLRSGVCAAAVVELPTALPALSVRRSALGGGIDFESGRFNEAFRVEGADLKFAHDVVNPRVMELLLDDPAAPTFRIEGPMLVVWREGKVTDAKVLRELAEFTARLLELIPAFALEGGSPGDGPISTMPPELLGEPPSGAIAFLQKLEYRGHQIERYEHVSEMWQQKNWAIVVKIDVPWVWPVCVSASKALVPSGVRPRFDDEYLTGDPAYDELFATGTPQPDFAKVLFTPQFTDFLANDPRALRAMLVCKGENYRAQLCVMTHGRLADQELADTLTDLVCDVRERLPAETLAFRW
ncbi:hypothetical protein [Kribbella speibonae]|uniref:DUF3137 domain-containing protein n=1 Tax=Kribbella speibonae TaxID=1572660 RepID=A0A4R0IP81_9ACTN|nr:hypothetical protein [Kribbella speibonae]TCC35511.1 hypothetical protein E0H92_22460 [Kribbella speibonae]